MSQNVNRDEQKRAQSVGEVADIFIELDDDIVFDGGREDQRRANEDLLTLMGMCGGGRDRCRACLAMDSVIHEREDLRGHADVVRVLHVEHRDRKAVRDSLTR